MKIILDPEFTESWQKLSNRRKKKVSPFLSEAIAILEHSSKSAPIFLKKLKIRESYSITTSNGKKSGGYLLNLPYKCRIFFAIYGENQDICKLIYITHG